MTLVVIFIVLVFLYSLLSGRLARGIITTPMVFTLAGMLVPPGLSELSGLSGQPDIQNLWLKIAEVGLVLLLFTDASRTDLKVLGNIRNLPTRLLSIGMLLTLLLGTLAGLAVFPGFSLWEAGILAAILAPTDAGLGQIIVNSPKVPMKIRQALNVEAGLNDGLSVPFLLFFIALAGADAGSQNARLMSFIIEQLGYGVLVGLGIGLAGGGLLGWAARRRWIDHGWRQFGVVALPLFCLLASEHVGASMFIAAFVAGLAVQVGFKDAGAHSVEFTDEWGQLLNLSVFFFFGVMVALDWHQFTPAHAMYAMLSLTVVRVLPVAIALAGTHMKRATVLFMGWFGPRGLASIVLGLVYLEEAAGQSGAATTTIRLTVMMTVLLSIFAHGLTAMPGIQLYARKIGTEP